MQTLPGSFCSPSLDFLSLSFVLSVLLAIAVVSRVSVAMKY